MVAADAGDVRVPQRERDGHRGELLDRSPQFQVHVLSGEVQPRAGATPYVRVGNAAFLALAGLMLLAGLRRRAAPARTVV